MGNLLCSREEEPVPERARITGLLESYKPDHTLHFEGGKVLSRKVRANTCQDEGVKTSKGKNGKEELIEPKTLEQRDLERRANLMRSSLRPSKTLDLEKRERVIA